MKCPHLRPWQVETCKIEQTLYVPSVFQLQEYCKTKGHEKCPFFVQSLIEEEQIKGQLSVREYA